MTKTWIDYRFAETFLWDDRYEVSQRLIDHSIHTEFRDFDYYPYV